MGDTVIVKSQQGVKGVGRNVVKAANKIMSLQKHKLQLVEREARTNSMGDTAVIKVKQGFASTVPVAGRNVVKTAKKKHQKHNLVEREVCVLQLLQRFAWAPRLIGSKLDTITQSFVGRRITSETLPADSIVQFNQILANMASVGVKHNNIIYPCRPNKVRKIDMTTLDGRLSLVDFGWATVNDSVPCNASDQKFKSVRNWKACPDTTMLQVLDDLSSQKGNRLQQKNYLNFTNFSRTKKGMSSGKEFKDLNGNTFEETSSKQSSLSSVGRVLLYFTTFPKKQHLQIMTDCWPRLIQKSTLLRNADVLVFLGGKVSPSFLTEWTTTLQQLHINATLQYNPANPGYQKGAMKAAHALFQNGWWKGYDWIIRLNPDVLNLQ